MEDVYKRQIRHRMLLLYVTSHGDAVAASVRQTAAARLHTCLLYTSNCIVMPKICSQVTNKTWALGGADMPRPLLYIDSSSLTSWSSLALSLIHI